MSSLPTRARNEPMTLRLIGQVVGRWKWIWIPAVVLGLVAGAGLFEKTPKTYTVTSSYVFLSPAKDTTGLASNPFITGGNGLPQTADLVALTLTDKANLAKFTAGHPKLQYTIARDPSVNATLVNVSVQDVSASSAFSALDALGTAVQAQLAELQKLAGAPTSQWITASRLTRDENPTVSIAKGLRNGALGLVGMLVLAVVVMVFAERIRIRRTTRAGRGAPRDSSVVETPRIEPDRRFKQLRTAASRRRPSAPEDPEEREDPDRHDEIRA